MKVTITLDESALRQLVAEHLQSRHGDLVNYNADASEVEVRVSEPSMEVVAVFEREVKP